MLANHASSLHLPYPPLFSLTISKQEQVTKKFPNENKGMTPQHIYTIPTSCAILPTMHNKETLYTHSLNEHGTQHCSLHSLPHKRRSTSATFISNKILQHNLNSQHTIPSITAHSFCIQDRLYLPCSVATTLQPPTTCTTHSMHINVHNTQQYPPHYLPQPSYSHNYQTQNIIGKCRDGVNVFWCHSHLVWLVFERFIPVPIWKIFL